MSTPVYVAIVAGYTEGSVAEAIGDDFATWRMRDEVTFGTDNTPSGLQRYRPRMLASACRMPQSLADACLARLVELGAIEVSADRTWMYVRRKAEVQFSKGGPGSMQNRLTSLWLDVVACQSADLRARFVEENAERFQLDATAQAAGSDRGTKVKLLGLIAETAAHRCAPPRADGALVRADGAPARTDGAPPRTTSLHNTTSHSSRAPTHERTHTSAPVPAREAPPAATAAAGGSAPPETPPERKPRAQDEIPPAERDPWPERASEAAAKRWAALCESDGKVPRGDSVEPFQRAAVLLRDKHGVPPDEVSATLVALVERAHRDPKRIHPKHGDLFTDSRRLLGGQGAIPPPEKVATMFADFVEAREAAKPRPRPALQVVEDDGFRIPRYTPEELAHRPKWIRDGYAKAYAIEDALDAAAAARAGKSTSPS